MDFSVDITLIISLIAALSAIIAPVLTALINNHHQYKMHKLEVAVNRKIDAIESYVSSCSNYLASTNRCGCDDYYVNYGKIFLYVRRKHWKDIEALHKAIESGDLDSAANMLDSVCQALASDIKI